MVPTGQDVPLSKCFERVLTMTGRAALPAMGLAIVSALTLIFVGFLLAPVAAIGFVLLHGVFVIALARNLLNEPLAVALTRPKTWLGGAILAILILPFVWLDSLAANYSCADGQIYNRSIVPALPWFLIGLVLLNALALPTRLALWRARTRLLRLPERIILTAAMVPPVIVLGFPFERKAFDCTAPFEGWGLFEGGLFLIPLLGLFLFAASGMTAVLAGTFALGAEVDATDP